MWVRSTVGLRLPEASNIDNRLKIHPMLGSSGRLRGLCGRDNVEDLCGFESLLYYNIEDFDVEPLTSRSVYEKG